MKTTKKLLILAIASFSTVVVASDYKGDRSKFATEYKNIVIEPQWVDSDTIELVRPLNVRRWVYLGAPFTPHALNGNKANFPEFHNVYVQEEAFQHYRDHGVWPEGTMMAKELQLVDRAVGEEGVQKDGSRYEPSGRGYFPGKVNGMDVAVKDSTRFSESKNWGYFNFGHHAPPYKVSSVAASIGECAGCHEPH